MAWECRECQNKFDDSIKPQLYGLCKTCYFEPSIAKQYRKGGPKYFDPAYTMVDDHQLEDGTRCDEVNLKKDTPAAGVDITTMGDETKKALKHVESLAEEAGMINKAWSDFYIKWGAACQKIRVMPIAKQAGFLRLMYLALRGALTITELTDENEPQVVQFVPDEFDNTCLRPVQAGGSKPSGYREQSELDLMLKIWPGRCQPMSAKDVIQQENKKPAPKPFSWHGKTPVFDLYVNNPVCTPEEIQKSEQLVGLSPMSPAQAKSLAVIHQELAKEDKVEADSKKTTGLEALALDYILQGTTQEVPWL